MASARALRPRCRAGLVGRVVRPRDSTGPRLVRDAGRIERCGRPGGAREGPALRVCACVRACCRHRRHGVEPARRHGVWRKGERGGGAVGVGTHSDGWGPAPPHSVRRACVRTRRSPRSDSLVAWPTQFNTFPRFTSFPSPHQRSQPRRSACANNSRSSVRPKDLVKGVTGVYWRQRSPIAKSLPILARLRTATRRGAGTALSPLPP
jgi:hypothetical protein